MRPFVAACALFFAAASITSCRRVPLRPGTGGLRVRVRGGARGVPVHVWIGLPYSDTAVWSPRHMTVTNGEALFVDLPPGAYRIAANDEQGRGGYYGTWGGHDTVLLRAGQVEDESVSMEAGLPVRGRVIDAQTHAPIENVYVSPPTRAASPTWPVALPWFWCGTDANGAFAMGGLPATGNPTRPSSPIWFHKAGYAPRSVELPPAGGTDWVVELDHGPR